MELIEKAAPSGSTGLGAVVGLFYEPGATFARLDTRRSTWLPLLLILAANVALVCWYFLGFVDYAWFQEQMLAAVSDPAQREQQGAMAMSMQTMAGVTSFGLVFALLFSFAISGVYFAIVSKVCNIDFKFGRGFALAVWASVPLLLTLPLGAVQMMLGSAGQLPFEALNPLSLNQLVFQYGVTHPMSGILDSISVLLFWNLFLLIIGYQAWANVKRATAAKIVVLPYIVIYGIWFAFALSRA